MASSVITLSSENKRLMSIGEQLKNQILVRWAEPGEPVREWLEANSERNAFDPGILSYPALKVFAAQNCTKVHSYIPIHQPTMIESIGVNPESTPLEKANAVMETVKVIASLTHQAGQREIYFLASDETTAKGAELMGFSEIPFRVFRRRL